jgi:hypothetical protein
MRFMYICSVTCVRIVHTYIQIVHIFNLYYIDIHCNCNVCHVMCSCHVFKYVHVHMYFLKSLKYIYMEYGTTYVYLILI